jgi:hypothetical protein
VTKSSFGSLPILERLGFARVARAIVLFDRSRRRRCAAHSLDAVRARDYEMLKHALTVHELSQHRSTTCGATGKALSVVFTSCASSSVALAWGSKTLSCRQILRFAAGSFYEPYARLEDVSMLSRGPFPDVGPPLSEGRIWSLV